MGRERPPEFRRPDPDGIPRRVLVERELRFAAAGRRLEIEHHEERPSIDERLHRLDVHLGVLEGGAVRPEEVVAAGDLARGLRVADVRDEVLVDRRRLGDARAIE
jgi:hypothetical protein